MGPQAPMAGTMTKFTKDDEGKWYWLKVGRYFSARKLVLVQVLQSGKGVFWPHDAGCGLLSPSDVTECPRPKGASLHQYTAYPARGK